jgi:hypothetical protein
MAAAIGAVEIEIRRFAAERGVGAFHCHHHIP